MGVDIQFARSLVQDHKHFSGKTDAVMLGRQGWAVRKRFNALLRRTMRDEDVPREMDRLTGPDGFAEPFFDLLGLPGIQSMDMSAYENCDVVHDLNEPPRDELRNRFDVVIDGGTIEHVFNTPQALDGVFHMLRDDGIFISINGMTGWAGHGFYQFSPEIVWRYWGEARGCEVIRCLALPENPSLETRDVTDTGKAGRRFRGRDMPGRWYLYYIIRKTAEANPAERITNTQQSDYAVRWSNAEQRKGTA